MNVHPATGEVTPEKSKFSLERGATMLDFHPTTPAEMEYFIREAVGWLEELPDVLLEINNRRYDAERAHIAKKAKQMAHYGRNGVQATFARAMADADAEEELKTWLDIKAEYHYAAGTERALRTKVNAMLNINRAIAHQFGVHR